VLRYTYFSHLVICVLCETSGVLLSALVWYVQWGSYFWSWRHACVRARVYVYICVY